MSKKKIAPLKWQREERWNAVVSGRVYGAVFAAPGGFHWRTLDGRNTANAGEQPVTFHAAKRQCAKHIRKLRGEDLR